MIITYNDDTESKYKKVAQIIAGAGGTPIPITEKVIAILKHFATPEDLDFLMAFKRKITARITARIKRICPK
ncbi:MAG: hypothetical protein ACTSYC_03670 [Promethearchaeota archaeon]